jgi:hypothetical protein
MLLLLIETIVFSAEKEIEKKAKRSMAKMRVGCIPVPCGLFCLI